MVKAERERMAKIKESGCLPCLLVTGKTRPPDVHHLTKAGRRTGAFIGACPYHHRGVITEGMTWQQESGLLGPSLCWGRKPWEEHFGSDDLLLDLQDKLLVYFEATPWYNYQPHRNVVLELQHIWHRRRTQ